jgi:Protein of unknown function (DUF3551)
MRMIIAATAILLACSVVRAEDPYRWCAQQRTGASNCYYITHKQCREAISGVGGSCTRNPFYTGPDAPWKQQGKRR